MATMRRRAQTLAPAMTVTPDAPGTLSGLRVVSFESRRAVELAELLRRHGTEPLQAPSMREVALDDNPAAHDFARRLLDGRIDVVILLTGVGTRALVAAVETSCPRAQFAEALGRTVTIARGPKPVAALRELGLTPSIVIPEPNTWREILRATEDVADVSGRRVAVQEYGVSNSDLIDGLAARGAEVLAVPVYRWALPADTRPLRRAAHALADGEIDVALFTSATQAEHLLQMAREEGVEDRLKAACRLVLVASIGPVCSDALRALGLPPDLEPEHPKMGHLVREVAERSRRLLEEKRARAELDPPGSIA
jgi:uroporphyrinogen-III synthase